jgi:hypothetical protein
MAIFFVACFFFFLFKQVVLTLVGVMYFGVCSLLILWIVYTLGDNFMEIVLLVGML